MNTLLVLQNRAVKAAQEARWTDAQRINQEILEQDARNIGALNRLGFAYLQDGQLKKAQKTYQQVLELDRANQVARKYLDVIVKKRPIVLPKSLRHSDFIDEPGKTKSVNLVRLGGPEVIDSLSIGSNCALKATKSRVGVHCERKYIGSLPDDVSSRVRPLLAAGNQYSVKIQSLKNKNVTIFIRELSRGPAVAHLASFPTDNLSVIAFDPAEINDENSPLYVAETEEDSGSSILGSAGIDEALDASDENFDRFSDEDDTND